MNFIVWLAFTFGITIGHIRYDAYTQSEATLLIINVTGALAMSSLFKLAFYLIRGK